MSFFSRLSDIISCNLNDLLRDAADPAERLHEIIAEMEQGLAGARRSVNAASSAEEKLRLEIAEHRTQMDVWTTRAREELAKNREHEARTALVRKRELEDLLGGLTQQHTAAVATRDQLVTTLRAIDARIADARRREQRVSSGESPSSAAAKIAANESTESATDRSRDAQIDAELEALRRELHRP